MMELNGKILVVDDNRMNRLKLSRSLEQQGHQVELAEDGLQALNLLRKTACDVVLLDIIMPGMDGYQVLHEIKSDLSLRDIPVIVISALEEIDSAVRCIEQGAEDYLPKSFDPVLLRARINACMQKKKLRDLEKAYLQQEVMLRQNEKLATLGRLSAGMAHELNNPVSAIQRGASRLEDLFADYSHLTRQLASIHLSPSQLALLLAQSQYIQDKVKNPADLDQLARLDRESEIEQILTTSGIENAWEFTSALVNLEYPNLEFESFSKQFTQDLFAILIQWICTQYSIHHMIEEISSSSQRVTGIVAALKSYSFMDQAPIQDVEVHLGLDNTLQIMQNKILPGVAIRKIYADNLPVIPAFGAELNQVWTHLLDNAIDAVAGSGEIIIRTTREKDWLCIEITDNGPGIPEENLNKIFDPFFTTKPPGEGTGMGLTICHTIVVTRHKGKILVHSQPGRTTFEVKLPLEHSSKD